MLACAVLIVPGSGGSGLHTMSVARGNLLTSTANAVGGTTYYYQVAAVNASGEARSAEQSVTPLTPGPPAAPALTAIGGNGHVQLIWSIPADNGSPLTGFTVSRGTTPGGESTLITLGPTATSFDTSLLAKPGGQYLFSRMATIGRDRGLPADETPRTPVTGSRIFGGLVPCNVIPDEILTHHPARFRAMLVESSNPAHSLADSARMREALAALDMLVVIDVAMTETAAASSVLNGDAEFILWLPL